MANLLSADDSDFEGGNGTWVANNVITLANSTTFANTGTHSLQMTSTSASGPMIANTGFYDGVVTAGDVLTVRASFRAASGAGVACQMYIDWYTSGHAFISSTFDSGTVDPSGAWTTSSASPMTAPATTGSFVLNCQVFITTSGEVHYLDTVSVDKPSYLGPPPRNLNVYRM